VIHCINLLIVLAPTILVLTTLLGVLGYALYRCCIPNTITDPSTQEPQNQN